LPEVRIELEKDSIPISGTIQVVTGKKTQLYAPEDVGALTQKIAGVTLKNYGGIGGMKTISFRGLSGTNTSVLIDGFSVQNTMVGQLDLSNLQVDNIQRVTFSAGLSDDDLMPISALMQGNVLAIKTVENTQSLDTMELRICSKVGSFGQVDNYASYKRGVLKSLFSVYGKYRTFTGNYPYVIENGMLTTTHIRMNNQLQEGYAGMNFSKDLNQKWKLRSSVYFNQSQRGLPGAVILYNESASQELSQQNTSVNISGVFKEEKWNVNVYNSLNYGYLNYRDPSYLNNSGGLNQWYFNTINQSGLYFNRKLKDSLLLIYGGVEHTYSGLHATSQYMHAPKRFHVQSLVGMKAIWKRFLGNAQVGNHWLYNQFGSSDTYTKAFASFAQIEKRAYNNVVGLPRIWFKQTFRMPSFSELYYNTIGSKSLEPELALQFSVGTSYRFLKNSLNVSLDGYYNKVDNKILAIPTKNLFVWSIMNIGKVQIAGVDLIVRKNWMLYNNARLDIGVNYSYQQVMDISNEKSTTYKNQLAYFPKHTIQSEITFIFQSGFGVHLNNSSISDRFVLNENSEENRLAGFSKFDCTLFSSWTLGRKQKLKISLSVKNCTNQSYQYISYFVMPGRNYLMSLHYAFN